MSRFEGKSNNEIILEIKQIEVDHEAIKQKLINDWDKMVDMEKRWAEAKKEINRRLNK